MMMQLTPPQVHELVKLLLQCPAIEDRTIRSHVLALLPDNLHDAIDRHNQNRVDVVSIVTTCNNYPGALKALIEGVRCYDEGTWQMQALEAFWQNLVQPEIQDQPERLTKTRLICMRNNASLWRDAARCCAVHWLELASCRENSVLRD